MNTALGVVSLPHDLYVGGFASIIREQARPVGRVDDDIRALVREMWVVLDSLGAGGGLAAPQVGVPLRLFVVELRDAQHPFGLHPPDPQRERDFQPIRACVIDPEVISSDPRTELDRESCYSLSGYRGVLPRSLGLRLRCFDDQGTQVEWNLAPWPARVFAHEIDHLDGVLYADRCVGPLEPTPIDDGQEEGGVTWRR